MSGVSLSRLCVTGVYAILCSGILCRDLPGAFCPWRSLLLRLQRENADKDPAQQYSETANRMSGRIEAVAVPRRLGTGCRYTQRECKQLRKSLRLQWRSAAFCLLQPSVAMTSSTIWLSLHAGFVAYESTTRFQLGLMLEAVVPSLRFMPGSKSVTAACHSASASVIS